MLAGLTFPIFLAIVPLFFILQGSGCSSTLPGLIITYVGVRAAVHRVLPVLVLPVAARTRSRRPRTIDGAGEWRTFFQVMLPMAKPGSRRVAIMNFLGLWNQFLLPVALNTEPARTTCCRRAWRRSPSSAGYSVDFGALFAAVMITIVPVLIVYILFQRQLQGSVSQGTSK